MQEYAGVIALVCGIAIAVLVVFVILLLVNLRSHVVEQKLTFLGVHAADVDTRKQYAEFTIGNKSLNDVGISALGVKNGKVSFDLTDLCKTKLRIAPDARIVIEQRSTVKFRLDTDEIMKLLVDGKEGKKVLKTLRVYAVDTTGKLFKGRVPAVRGLLAVLMRHPPVYVGVD